MTEQKDYLESTTFPVFTADAAAFSAAIRSVYKAVRMVRSPFTIKATGSRVHVYGVDSDAMGSPGHSALASFEADVEVEGTVFSANDLTNSTAMRLPEGTVRVEQDPDTKMHKYLSVTVGTAKTRIPTYPTRPLHQDIPALPSNAQRYDVPATSLAEAFRKGSKCAKDFESVDAFTGGVLLESDSDGLTVLSCDLNRFVRVKVPGTTIGDKPKRSAVLASVVSSIGDAIADSSASAVRYHDSGSDAKQVVIDVLGSPVRMRYFCPVFVNKEGENPFPDFNELAEGYGYDKGTDCVLVTADSKRLTGSLGRAGVIKADIVKLDLQVDAVEAKDRPADGIVPGTLTVSTDSRGEGDYVESFPVACSGHDLSEGVSRSIQMSRRYLGDLGPLCSGPKVAMAIHESPGVPVRAIGSDSARIEYYMAKMASSSSS